MPRVKATSFVFEPVQLVRSCEIVAYRITEAIRAGDVKVGERLPSEQVLSKQLGVSRPTLRDAIKLLVEAKVLEVLPGSSGGIFVISQTIPPELTGFPLPEMPLHDISSVLEARRLFEPHVARMAALYGTPLDFLRMREAIQLSKDISSTWRGKEMPQEAEWLMTLASTRFNLAIARATQNPTIVSMMEILLRRLEQVRTIALRFLPDISMSTQTLENTLRAIESGDPARIDAATAQRLTLLENAWAKACEPNASFHRRLPLESLMASKL